MNEIPLWVTLVAAWLAVPFLCLLWPPYRDNIFFRMEAPPENQPQGISDQIGPPKPIDFLLRWVLWPLLLFVLLQDRFKPIKDEITLDPPLTSDEIEAFVSDFAQRYPRGFPLAESGNSWEAGRSAFAGVPIVSRDDVYERLDELGIGITGAARLDTGEPLILPFKFGGSRSYCPKPLT
jgi:hypothetical protein